VQFVADIRKIKGVAKITVIVTWLTLLSIFHGTAAMIHMLPFVITTISARAEENLHGL
jgi:hypothetical protein